MRKWLLFILFAGCAGRGYAQQLTFPDSTFRHSIKEGQEVSFRIGINSSVQPKFTLDGINGFGIQFDSVGNFSWKPSFDLVDRLEKQKVINLIVQAEWKDGKKMRSPLNFTVYHQNRPPFVDDLPVFYVKQSSLNVYQISSDYVHDEDKDPIVFKAIPSQMPEGATLSAAGLLEWKPARNQFVNLKNNPLTIEFTVQDQPEKAEGTGKIKIAQTQLDLPPEMFFVPGDTAFTIKEDERVNFKLVVTDPNGDENISNVGFVSTDPRVPVSTLITNSAVQFEFNWSPGYDFVSEVRKLENIDIVFFAIDKSSNKVQKKIHVKVLDSENLVEKDRLLYDKYKNMIVDAKILSDLLDAKQKQLNKDYKQAKKGKKNRAVVSAGLGGTAGVSAVASPTPTTRTVSGLSGAFVGVLGTLEATEVLGRSKSDILEMIKTDTEIRNQLQIEGDNFARKYALKSVRREKPKEFEDDREKLMLIVNNQKLATLELDAQRPDKTKISTSAIRKTFADFAEE